MDRNVSFFDLDHTLLQANCSFHFGLYLYKKNIVGATSLFQLFWFYFLHKCGQLDIYGIHKRSFDSLFRGRKSKEFREHGEDFVEESYHRLINLAVLDLLLEKQEQGERVLILSSSPDFLVEAFAKKMGVLECFSTIYQTDSDGLYHQIDKVLEGNEKSKLVKQMTEDQQIPHANTTGYSDSHHDLPFLESVAVPIAVNPNRTLRKVCKKRGWDVFLGT